MPTNVSPEYKKAEEAYRKAREPGERLDCLKEMVRTIPKHKGTDYLQADIKTRIKQLTEELAGPRKGGRKSGPTGQYYSMGVSIHLSLPIVKGAGRDILAECPSNSNPEIFL